MRLSRQEAIDCLLCHLVNRGDVEGVKLALMAGAMATSSARGRGTALHYAAIGGHTGIIRLLLEHGADPTVKCDGRTPLDIAREHSPNEEADGMLERAAAEWNEKSARARVRYGRRTRDNHDR